MRIILSGASGKMGKAVYSCVKKDDSLEIVSGIDKYDDGTSDFNIVPSPEQINCKADVIIDFSNPALLSSLLELAKKQSIPIVLATTGYSNDDYALIDKAAQEIPVFTSANMSVGINLMVRLLKKATEVLGNSSDIEIIEKHHNQKIDAPSGTALMLADAISDVLDSKPKYVYDRHSVREKRTKNEIGIHSIRGGNIVGEHEVLFACDDEVLEIKHTAASKVLLANGALKAAQYIVNKQAGRYNMDDLIG